jgi:hypothetical protein
MGADPASRIARDDPAAEARLALVAPGYLDRVRDAARRLGVGPAALANDARAAVEGVAELSMIDIDIPTYSRRPVGRLAKEAIKRGISWYLRYIGVQISALGQSVAHMGTCLLDRTERLEDQAAGLRAEIARLSDRLDEFERGGRDQ